MTGKLSPKKIQEVFYAWLDGKDYKTIKKETGVGNTKIYEILKVVNSAIHDVEELRKLKIDLNAQNISAREAAAGLGAQRELRSLNLTENDVNKCASLLNRYGGDAPSVLEQGLRLSGIEARVGKRYDTIVNEAAEKSKQIAASVDDIKALSNEKSALEGAMPELESLRKLKSRLDSYPLSAEELNGFIGYHLWLQKSGFTIDTAKLFASALKHEDLDPKRAADIFPSLIIKGKNLSASTKDKEAEYARLAARAALEKQKLMEQAALQEKKLEKLASDEKNCNHSLDELKGQIAQNKDLLDVIQKEIADKTSEKDSIEAKISELDTSITEYEKTVHGKMRFRILVSLTETPKASLDRMELIEALIALSEGAMVHINQNSAFYNSLILKERFRGLSSTLLEELQHAKQVS